MPSSPPRYTKVALIPGRAEDTIYFYSGFNQAETVKLARDLLKICSTYFCWVFFVGCLNLAASLRSNDEKDRFDAGWSFTWNVFGAWLLVYLGVQGIKTRNAPLCCCGYLNWFLGWMYVIGIFALLEFFIGIMVLAKQPNLPHGCDSWKGTHPVNNTDNNGTVVNGTHSVPNVKGDDDVDCIKDTPFAIVLMVFSMISLVIVGTAVSRARAFLRHLINTARDHADVAPTDNATIQIPPAYVASHSNAQDAPLLLAEKAPAYSNI